MGAQISYTLAWDEGGVVLPAADAGDDCWSITTFDDGGEAAWAHLAALATTGRSSGGSPVRVHVALIHRPDNDYNPNAVSVALPGSHGGDPDDRHLGFLHDYRLRRVGMSRLPELAEMTGGEIRCTGWLFPGPDLVLDLPRPEVLGEALEEYLGPRRHSPRWHTVTSDETAGAVQQIRSFDKTHEAVRGLRLSTLRFPGSSRSISLLDSDSSRCLGEVSAGLVILDDERDREAVLRLLDGTPLEFARPLPAGGLWEAWAWPPEAVPNLRAHVLRDGIEFRTEGDCSGQLTVARFNSSHRKLWIEDSRLAAPCLIYAARLGLPVDAYDVPRVPWHLGDEVPPDELTDRSFSERGTAGALADLALLERVRHLVPAHLSAALNIRWLHRPDREIDHESERLFHFLAESTAPRRILFGDHVITPPSGTCRLCGARAPRFVTPLSTEELAYCDWCLSRALSGLGRDRTAAATALRLIGELEFEGNAVLESQLNAIHINPADPKLGEVIDQALLLRLGIRRGAFPWTHLLDEAGLLVEGLRAGRGTILRARDGHLCLSLGEKAVCDFLYRTGVAHDREPLYPRDPILNTHGLRRADWRLDDGTLVELWGMPNDDVYAAKMRQKRMLASKHGLRLLELSSADLPGLREAFAPWMTDDETADAKSAWTPNAAGEGGANTRLARERPASSDSNADSMRQRVERCLKSVRLQRAGYSRAMIGSELGLGVETVKGLLRDGRFYLNPQSDASRLADARAATAARLQGQTFGQFLERRGGSPARAKEAWRDSAALGVAMAIDPSVS